MTNFKTGWHLIYTRPNHERKVSIQLSDRKIETYLPLFNEERKWSDRIKITQRPIFPCYLFVYLNNCDDYYEAMHAEGSCYYVKSGSRVALVSNEEIDHIRLMEKGGRNIEVANTILQAGQRLIIGHGPLHGLSCEVIQHKGKDRILVRVSILQRSLLADIPSSSLV
jgi:transcription antitermination factor NusG